MRNKSSDLHTLHSDALPLSHRDSTVGEACYKVHIWQASCTLLGLAHHRGDVGYPSLRNSHDYFLSDVLISTIASFNRMKQITDDLNLVVKAMKTSSMLEVGFTNCFKKILQACTVESIFQCDLWQIQNELRSNQRKIPLERALDIIGKNSCWNWGFFLLFIFNGF